MKITDVIRGYAPEVALARVLQYKYKGCEVTHDPHFGGILFYFKGENINFTVWWVSSTEAIELEAHLTKSEASLTDMADVLVQIRKAITQS